MGSVYDKGSASGELERLASEAAQRALERQDHVLTELRSRTGVLLAAASVAASLLGAGVGDDSASAPLVVLALAAFTCAVALSVYILWPREKFTFGPSGSGMYEGLYEFRDDPTEIHRRLIYDLGRFWDENDAQIAHLFRLYRLAAAALIAEVILLVAVVSGTLS